jgi:predicted methyltransferase
MKTHSLVALAASVLLSLCAPVAAKPNAIASAIADPTRPQADRDTDAARNPAATLAFAGIKRGQKIGELLPGGGYYTRLLSDVVGPKGKVFALETTRWGKQNLDATRAVLSEPGHANVVMDEAAFGEFNLSEPVDVFWTTLNYHDLHIAKYGVVDMAKFNKHVFNSLKPGGTYFIVDHAAEPGTTDLQTSDLHRIDKARVIAEVTAAGFKLVSESQLLHRVSDDHSKSVFDPAVRGKTDQFVLKFRKP